MELWPRDGRRYSRRQLSVDLAAGATSRRNLAAAMKTRQLASWPEETFTIASCRGVSSNTEHRSSQINRADRKDWTSAPTQLTLDTPRASAGAAEADLSEKHRALPARQRLASKCGAWFRRSTHAHFTEFCRARNIVANQGAFICHTWQ
jgi:hypothetical protein